MYHGRQLLGGFISLPPASLAAFAQTMTGRALTTPRLGEILRRPRGIGNTCRAFMGSGAPGRDGADRFSSHPNVVRAMEQELWPAC